MTKRTSATAFNKAAEFDLMEALEAAVQAYGIIGKTVVSDLQKRGFQALTSEQALLIWRVQKHFEEFNVLHHDDLTKRGYYFGTNASYNLKKLTEMGLMASERNGGDRRRTDITLTEKGAEVGEIVAGAVARVCQAAGKNLDVDFVRRAGGAVANLKKMIPVFQ